MIHVRNNMNRESCKVALLAAVVSLALWLA